MARTKQTTRRDIGHQRLPRAVFSRLSNQKTVQQQNTVHCVQCQERKITESERLKITGGEKKEIAEGKKSQITEEERRGIVELKTIQKDEKTKITEEEKSKISKSEGSGIAAEGEKSKIAVIEPQNVVAIHIFRAKLTSPPTDDDFSTLVITESGDVFGKGCNSLVGFYHNSPLPMKQGAGRKLETFTKLEQFSGLRMKKIKVGVGFGVGLAAGNLLYMWGGGPQTLRAVAPDSTVIFLAYREGKCYCGLDHNLICKRYADADLSDCIVYGLNCNYDTDFSDLELLPDDAPVRVFARWGDDNSIDCELDCDQCGGICGGLCIGDHYVNHCEKCDKLQEVCFDVPRPSKEMAVPRRMLFDVIDVDCGASFLCYLKRSTRQYDPDQLWILRWRRTRSSETPLKYETPVQLAYQPSASRTISSFSCGKAHIAAITDSGELYMYGQRYGERIDVGENALQPVILKRSLYDSPAPVKKICCGDETTLCLLANQSIWLVRGDVQQIIHTVSQSLDFNRNFFTDIIGSVNMVEHFFLQENSSVWSVRRNAYQRIEVTRCENADIAWFMDQKLKKSATPAEHEKSKGVQVRLRNTLAQLLNDVQPAEKKLKLGIPSTATEQSEQAPRSGLYGKSLLSDVTLKLADGEFPAHRQLLFTASNYFRKRFTTNTDRVLDMSAYNAKAYKTLLQYFYGEKPADIGLEDLLDLYGLATTYGETAIARTVSDQLNLLVNVDTVLPILAKAKAYDDKILHQKCEKVLRSPAYHEKILENILQDPSKFIH